MPENSYVELKTELQSLQDALDNESNPEMRKDIEAEISDVTMLINNEDYDLSIDDLFKCEQCNAIKDIEESVKEGHSLICEDCDGKVAAK